MSPRKSAFHVLFLVLIKNSLRISMHLHCWEGRLKIRKLITLDTSTENERRYHSTIETSVKFWTLLVFNKLLSNLAALLVSMRSFPPCYPIFTNFSHSKIEKNESITKSTKHRVSLWAWYLNVCCAKFHRGFVWRLNDAPRRWTFTVVCKKVMWKPFSNCWHL